MAFVQIGIMGDAFFFSFGFSEQGLIPFEPFMLPDVFSQSEQAFLNGHYFVGGKGSFSEIPFSIEGNIVINLDANGDGSPLGVSSDDTVLNPDGSFDFDSLIDALDDVEVGVNGKLNAEIDFGAVGLTIPLASASLMFQDDIIAFKGGTEASPFSGTVLDFISVTTASIDGHINFATGAFEVEATMNTPRVGGFRIDGSARMIITNTSATFRGDINSPIPFISGSARLYGNIDTSGLFTLRANVHASIPVGPVTHGGSANFELTNVGGFSFSADLKVGVTVSAGVCDIFLGVMGDINISTSGSISGSGHIGGSCGDISVGLGFGFSTSGFYIDLPWPVPDFKFPP